MSGLLTEMAQASLVRLEQARARESEQQLWARVCDLPAPPALRLSPEGFDVIAECKLRSPSAGDLSAHTSDIETRVKAYAQGGACAVSVLTEPSRFGGKLEDLAQAAEALRSFDIPAMRKDFLVDPYQVMEARAAGAGGVLVIARMLDQSRITALLDCAAMLKMFVLLEAFDAIDLALVREVLNAREGHEEQVLVGLNCRDLEKLTVELSRLGDLASELPELYPRVAESGVTTLDDVKHVVTLGYNVALIGTTLMHTDDPARLLGQMLAKGREEAMSLKAQGDA